MFTIHNIILLYRYATILAYVFNFVGSCTVVKLTGRVSHGFVGVQSTLLVKAGEERDAVPPGLPSGFLTRHGAQIDSSTAPQPVHGGTKVLDI